MSDGAVDVLIVSLGSTAGLRRADDELLGSLRRAGARAELVAAPPARRVRTMALTDLAWASSARGAARAALARPWARTAPAIIYSSTTAALLWPRPGAVRFDAPATGNRPGRHGLWQRPLERRRLRESPLLLPWSEGALRELPASSAAEAVVLPVPVEPSGPGGARDIAAITYGANPLKKGLDRVLSAWQRARARLGAAAAGQELLVTGTSDEELRRAGIGRPGEGVRVVSGVWGEDYRALLRRARVFVCAPRREDYGIAQLEALADGCMLVTTAAPGPYAALQLARDLDPRLVGEDLEAALVHALGAGRDPGYARRAEAALAPYRRAAADRVVAEQVLPRLLAQRQQLR